MKGSDVYISAGYIIGRAPYDEGEGMYVRCSMHAQVDVGKRLEGWEEEQEEMKEGKKIVFAVADYNSSRVLSRGSTSACQTQPLWLCVL